MSPRQISAALWIEPSEITEEYSYEALTNHVVFDTVGLLDFHKFNKSVYVLKQFCGSIDIEQCYYSLYTRLSSALNPWKSYDFPDGCHTVAVYTPQFTHFSKLVQIAIKCLSQRIDTLTVYTHKSLDPAVLGILQPWLVRDVRGHYPAELVDISIEEVITIKTFNSTGEKNSELQLLFRTGDHPIADLIISDVEVGEDVPVITMDQVLAL